jgi:hypothetical protein
MYKLRERFVATSSAADSFATTDGWLLLKAKLYFASRKKERQARRLPSKGVDIFNRIREFLRLWFYAG